MPPCVVENILIQIQVKTHSDQPTPDELALLESVLPELLRSVLTLEECDED